jgi:predicted nucleotidyltransferase
MTAELPIEIRQLIANYKPEKVILFGSRVSGNVHDDSDYDFLIVKETTTRRLNRREEAMRGIKQIWRADKSGRTACN